MARFVFRLEVVLRQRKRAEQEAQRELAVRQARLVAAEDELKRLEERVRAASDDVRQNHLTGSLDLNFLSAHRRFLNAMQRQGMEIVQRIAAGRNLVEEARMLLAEAARNRKVIEKLRERQLARWREEQQRMESIAFDEIGMQIGYANSVEASDNSGGIQS
jgi:flagellar FliJ protein